MGAMAEQEDRHGFNARLYNALMRRDQRKVIDLCNEASENALHILTVHGDTVLHMATYSRQSDLVCKLLDKLPQDHLPLMTRKNDLGNTILHEAVTNQARSAAEAIFKKAPGLLSIRNEIGETALFGAARYGSVEMFNLLWDAISENGQADREGLLQRTDKTSVLHISVIYQHFDFALTTAKKHGNLIGESDVNGMTALQLLSCNQSAFENRTEDSLLEQLTRSGDAFIMQLIRTVKLCCSPARQDKLKKEKKRYISALELAKFLIKKDTSWEATYCAKDQSNIPQLHKYADRPHVSNCNFNNTGRKQGTPLFLATKSGILEIVEEILRCYPQAIEHIDHKGQNILHIAIKHRRLKIFKLLKKMELPMRRLAQKVDNTGNSILHMVGKKRKYYVAEKLRSPALELREELHWFERVKKVTQHDFLNHQNHMNQTAYVLFETNNSKLRKSATDWLKQCSKGCSLVAILIATVAYGAAYETAGDVNHETEPLFISFAMTDVLCIAFAFTAVVTFLSISTSSFRLEDFKNSLPNKLVLGFTFLFLSVLMIMASFGSTIIFMINNQENWTKYGLCSTTFLPVSIFALSYLPLYLSLSRTFNYFIKKAQKLFPKLHGSESIISTSPPTKSQENGLPPV